MKNIYNWLFGSFFRTLGRVFVYIIFGIILSYFLKELDIIPKSISILGVSNVYAETVSINKSNVAINSSTWYSNYGYYGSTFSTSGTQISFSLMCNMNQQNCIDYIAVVADVCVGTSIADYTRYYGYGASCPNSCFTQNPSYTDLGRSCKFNDTQSGYMYRLYMPINKWDIGSGNTPYYVINDSMKITAKWYNSTYQFTNLYFTDELVSDAGGWSSLDNSIISARDQAHQDAQQAHQDAQDTQNAINSQTNAIKDDNVTESENKAADFFNNFTTDNHGLTGIITAPLSAIQSLTSSTCTPLELPLPFVNQNITLPCMRPIYEEHFGSFMTLYDIITLGIISYWVMVRIFALVRNFKNPDSDEIEVLDL